MAHWLKRIGMASVLAFPLSVILYRFGLMSFTTGFVIIQVGAVIGALVFVMGLGYFLFRKNANPVDAKAALVGAIIALIPVVPLALQAQKAKSLPFIHNISTDIENAPKFDKVLALRTAQDNPHTYKPNQKIGESGKLGELQRAAYPNIKTHVSTLSAFEALVKAEAIVKAMGWELVNVDAAKGIIEATETTLLWGFKDDIVIRVSESAGQTLLDLHSVSRFGGSDIGVNAARIEAFFEAFTK